MTGHLARPYAAAVADGLFSLATLPPLLASEIDRYERAILALQAAHDALDWPLFTDAPLATMQATFCDDNIGELVQAVRDLHARYSATTGH
jgi:hypothetical protein